MRSVSSGGGSGATDASGATRASGACHTFGVPVVTSLLGNRRRVSWRAEGPLVPWQIHGAEDLWVPIDNTEALFRRFFDNDAALEAVIDTQHQAGHLVVVSGAKGSGKTTFLHRIVHELALRLDAMIGEPAAAPAAGAERWTLRPADLAPHVRIVPVAGPENDSSAWGWGNGEPASVETVNRRILDAIHQALREDIEGEVGDALKCGDVFQAYQALSKALVSTGRALLIVLPDFRWNDEGLTRRFYRSCYDNAMTGIVFLLESSGSQSRADLRAALGEMSRAHATHLEIGPLNGEDWRLFIESRYRAGIPGPQVRLADEVLHGEPEPWMRESVGTLRAVLHKVLQKAHGNQESEIGAAALRAYSDEFRRDDVDQFRRH